LASINDLGQVLAPCRGCQGGYSRFEFSANGSEFGVVVTRGTTPGYNPWSSVPTDYQHRLYRCVGCGLGALGVIRMETVGGKYPVDISELVSFYPEAKERLPLPKAVPEGIQREFREAELCLDTRCYRAAAVLFRSALDKTLLANGYRAGGSNLKIQIDEAAKDGVITAARKKRAHEDIRVLGNDIVHDEWRVLAEEDVEPAHRYIQRILEDLYDDRESVLKELAAAGRTPEDAKPSSGPGSST
jgi:hypothetical protein